VPTAVVSCRVLVSVEKLIVTQLLTNIHAFPECKRSLPHSKKPPLVPILRQYN
jgi:hypothetical protein